MMNDDYPEHVVLLLLLLLLRGGLAV